MQARAEEPTVWHSIVETLRYMSPGHLRDREFRLPSGTALISTVAARKPSDAIVSIIVPVFNEIATLQEMMDALVAKSLPGLRKEIIVVESNSTDGSRDLVQTYEGYPEVRVLLQPRPRGKGNAVREGLAAATGDIVMIQDADLEYDFDDYDGLLAPLQAWQTMFVLGTRHQGRWKMRKFNDAPFTAAVFNFGHWFFQTLMNVALRTQMTDPFTMFKLFRRDALFGIDLVCNRFDLDIELVMKLVRKGYIPLEIPVNYIARSFAEGKKVRFFRDGTDLGLDYPEVAIFSDRYQASCHHLKVTEPSRGWSRRAPARILSFLFSVALLVAGFVIFARRIQWDEMVRIWSDFIVIWLVAALVVCWMQYPISSWRQHLIIHWLTGFGPNGSPGISRLFFGSRAPLVLWPPPPRRPHGRHRENSRV